MNLAARPSRVASLDQFRGYTVLGMFVVNFVGVFASTHWLLKHHNTFCSYADTIMPQFFFAVGFAYRLTIVRRAERDGAFAAYRRVVRRLLGLIVLSLVIYPADRPAEHWDNLVQLGFWGAIQTPLKRDWFQTLMHIAVTSLWVLPVIRGSARIRIAWLLMSAAAHVALSQWFYFAWVNNGQPNGIDGGPLGFLTWTIPVLVGSLCADLFLRSDDEAVPVGRAFLGAAGLMLAGYLLSCGTRYYDVDSGGQVSEPVGRIAESPVIPAPEAMRRAWTEFAAGDSARLLAEAPFVPPPHPAGQIDASYRYRQWNYWMMSQRGGTLSYLTFGAGLSLGLFLVFHVLWDLLGLSLAVLRTLGTNALAGYVLHMLVADAVQQFMPPDAPAWYVWAGFAVYFLITYGLLRSLERAGVYLRL